MANLELMHAPDIAAELGVHVVTVQKWHRERRIPTVKLGKTIVIKRADFEAWFESVKAQQGAAAGA